MIKNTLEFNQKLEDCKIIPDAKAEDKSSCIMSLIEVQHTSHTKEYVKLGYDVACIFSIACVGFAILFFIKSKLKS